MLDAGSWMLDAGRWRLSLRGQGPKQEVGGYYRNMKKEQKNINYKYLQAT